MTCGEHAAIMAALVPADQMGRRARGVYDKLMAQEHEECIQAESQIVYLFMSSVSADMDEAAEAAAQAVIDAEQEPKQGT